MLRCGDSDDVIGKRKGGGALVRREQPRNRPRMLLMNEFKVSLTRAGKGGDACKILEDKIRIIAVTFENQSSQYDDGDDGVMSWSTVLYAHLSERVDANHVV